MLPLSMLLMLEGRRWIEGCLSEPRLVEHQVLPHPPHWWCHCWRWCCIGKHEDVCWQPVKVIKQQLDHVLNRVIKISTLCVLLLTVSPLLTSVVVPLTLLLTLLLLSFPDVLWWILGFAFWVLFCWCCYLACCWKCTCLHRCSSWWHVCQGWEWKSPKHPG